MRRKDKPFVCSLDRGARMFDCQEVESTEVRVEVEVDVSVEVRI